MALENQYSRCTSLYFDGEKFLGNSDFQNIKENEDFFNIESELKAKKSDIKNSLLKRRPKKSSKKTKNLRKNGRPYWFLPSVMISPYDAKSDFDGGESRRKFLDTMISQTDSGVSFNLIQYQKTLQQRNALLKYFQKTELFDIILWKFIMSLLPNSDSNFQKKRQLFL